MEITRRASSLIVGGLLFAVAIAACGREATTEPGASTAAPRNPALPGLERVKSGELETILSFDGRGLRRDLYMRVLGPFIGAGAGAIPQVDLAVEARGDMGNQPIDLNTALIATNDRAVLTYAGNTYETDRPTFDLLQASFQRALGDGSPADLAACLEAAARILPQRLWDGSSPSVSGTAIDGTAVETTSAHLATADLVQGLGRLQRDPGCGAQLRVAGMPGALLAEIEMALRQGSKSAVAELAVGKDGILRELSVHVALGSGQNVGSAEYSLRLGRVNDIAALPPCHGEQSLSALWDKLGFDPLKSLEDGEAEGFIGLLDGVFGRSSNGTQASDGQVA